MYRSIPAILLCGAVSACSQQSGNVVDASSESVRDGATSTDSDAPVNPDPPDQGTDSSDGRNPLCIAPDGSGGKSDASVEPDKTDPDPNVLWRVGDCAHPKVDRTCRDGWCSIPAGCFIIGSPLEEMGRGKYTEEQTAVTLTRPFHIQQYEFTCREWTALGLKAPTGEERVECRTPAHPLSNINWYEALMLANLLSERHDPPLPPCYKLSDCEGNLGEGVSCKTVEHTPPNLYECDGFRLPTEYEWEYAARAGTRTTFYSGGFAPETTYEMAVNCDCERNLEPIAWFCANSQDRTHPVGLKLPNAWGLHDVLGNTPEWTTGPSLAAYRPGPLEDPQGEFIEYEFRCIRGGCFMGWPTTLRVAGHFAATAEMRGPGVRLVRTGAENPGPIVKPVASRSTVRKAPAERPWRGGTAKGKQ